LSCSIILCSYNGAFKITKTLEAIAAIKTNFPWELIFIDNNSSDNTYSLALEILGRTDIDYRVESCEEPGKMNAFWKGIALAKYDYILDCDDDNHLFPDYLELGLNYLLSHKDVGALGGQGLEIGKEFPIWFDTYKKSYALGPQGKPFHNYFTDHSLYGAGCFYRKSILLGLIEKGFEFLMTCRKGESLSSGGDVELCYLISLSGFSVVYHPELKFFHDIPKERISWDYYIKLKKGITSGAGLLYAYEYFTNSKARDNFDFLMSYSLEMFKAYLLYMKYNFIWRGLPVSDKDKLAFEILKSRFQSFHRNQKRSFIHFKKLKRYFGD
jgi:glycosyltransferase involved in cell wall biosynthesis